MSGDTDPDLAPAPDATIGNGPRSDRLKQLRAFCEAVRTGSLSGAATALGTSQPAVSSLVRSLEEELGATLFRRTGGRVAPTRVGRSLHRIALPLAEGLMRLPELFEEHHRGVAGERLRIGAGEVSGGYVLPGLVRRFQSRCPHTRVDVRSGSGTRRLEWLRGFELDLVVAAFDVVPGDIEFHPLVHSDAVVITPEDHPLGRRESVAIGALSPYPMVAALRGHYARASHDAVLRLYGARPRIVLEVDGWSSMIHHVAEGVGIAIVPDLCVGAGEPVRAVRLEHPFQRRTYGLAVRRDRLMTLAASVFAEVAASGAAQQSGGAR